MDPNEALQSVREAMAQANKDLAAVNSIGNGFGHEKAREDLADATADLIDAVSALVGWLDGGGFLPESWAFSAPRGEGR